MERESTYLSLPLLERVQALDDARAATATLVAFELAERGDYTEGFDVVERGRARALLASFHGSTAGRPEPAAARPGLPADVAVVYYATLPDRVIGWVIAGGRTRHFVAAVPLAAVRRMVDRLSVDIQSGLALPEVQARSADLFSQLIAPALPLIGSAGRIVFVPDGPLWGLPFAIAPDSRGQPLIARYILTMAPSLAAFQDASASLSGFAADGVLAIGDGHDARLSALPHLAHADREAADVGAVYTRALVLAGSDATVRRVVSAAQPVVHFAGHAVANVRAPALSALLLAAEPGAGSDGGLTAGDIAGTHFVGAKVVVLATCDGAVGKLADGEGMLSLSQMFFAAGVPSVVASLWPVSDDATGLMVRFHRALRERRDASTALRLAQLNTWQNGGAVRDWAAFVAIGGVGTGAFE
jgi:CHAT domain-containing protein